MSDIVAVRGDDLTRLLAMFSELAGRRGRCACRDCVHQPDLRGADLRGADLRGAKNADLAIARTRIIPDEGPVIGWKKCYAKSGGELIVKLLIPGDAKRSHASGRKCRAERAEVLAITDLDGNPVDEAFSGYAKGFRYAVGAVVVPGEPFCEDMWQECASGIHWYVTRLEAVAHV